MSLFRPVLSRIAATRSFSTSPNHQASPLFHLSALSNRNETAYYNSISRLNRVNHSPALELIRNSEVKPFAKKEDVAITAKTTEKAQEKAEELMQSKGSMLDYAQAKPSSSTPILQAASSTSPGVDAEMLQTLQQMSTQLANLEAKLVDMGIETEKDVRRTGALVTLLAAGAVAGLGIWKFWPPEAVRNSDTFAKKHVQERSRILPSEVVVGHHAPATIAGVAAAMREPAVFPTAVPAVAPAVAGPAPVLQADETSGSWWRSLFWKEQ